MWMFKKNDGGQKLVDLLVQFNYNYICSTKSFPLIRMARFSMHILIALFFFNCEVWYSFELLSMKKIKNMLIMEGE